MHWTVEGNATRLSLRFKGKPRAKDALSLIAVPFVCLIACLQWYVSPILPIFGSALAFLIAAFACQRMFGESTLTITSDAVIIRRHTFGIDRTKQFSRTDTEHLDYQPEFSVYRGGHQDAALGLMARTTMTPARFANGISPAEAETVFDAIKQSGSWLGGQIVPIRTAA